jgi:hypothetical protein
MHGVLKLVVVAAMLALVGCAGVPQAPTSFALDLGQDKIFTFRLIDADGNRISDRQIGNALAQTVSQGTGYKRRSEQYSSDHVMLYVKGVEATMLPSAMRVDYVNGERDAQGVHLTRSSATFAYTATTDEGAGVIRVKVSPPRQLETVAQRNMLFIPYATLDKEQNLAGDVRQIYDHMAPSVVVDKLVTGEVNTPYGVDAIQANFKRKCRVYAPNPQGGMACILGTQTVNVSVAPYQNGSKTTYRFQVQYRLDSNGGSSYADDATKQMVASIERIVKD